MTYSEYKLLIEAFQSHIDKCRKAARAFAYDYVATGDEDSRDFAKTHMDKETHWRSALKVVEEFQADQLRDTPDEIAQESQP